MEYKMCDEETDFSPCTKINETIIIIKKSNHLGANEPPVFVPAAALFPTTPHCSSSPAAQHIYCKIWSTETVTNHHVSLYVSLNIS